MAINDFVRRSIQIVGGGIAQSTTDYFDNAISFVNDVKEVIDMGKQMGSDGAKKFNELKSSGILKKTRDWFYNEGGMFGDFDFDDEEFDAGFEIESADSENNAESSKPLSKDMMTDIAKKQTGAMYKAFGRQADLQIANTAEIISTINTRTAELTASVNNVNNTLIQIGKRLDLIVEWTSARTKKEEEEKRQAGILDYGGGISLTGVVNKAKENAEDSMLGTFLNIGKTMLGSGMMTPEMVMSMILSQTILDKKWDKLGKKSINDIGEFINDTVDEVIQNTLTKVLTTKNEMLSSLFEDIITKAGGKNYQNSVVNQYNDKPAVFDGMTRKSIVTVIPGYLNEILKAVSKDGMGREIDKKGNLTKKKSNSFINEISDNYFRAGMVGYRERDEAEKRLKSKLTGRDINTAIRALSGTWAYYMYRRGITILEVGEVTDFNAPSTRWVVETTAELLAAKRSEGGQYSVDEWMNFLHVIINEIDEFKFRKELQRNADRADKAFEDFAKHHVNAHQAKTIDYGMLLQAWDKNYSDFNKDLDTQSNTSAVNPTQIGSNQTSTSITTQDIAAGIFQRLNEGINVFVTGKKNLRKTPYAPIKLKAGFAKDLLNMSPVQQASAAVEATKSNVTAAANAANKVIDVAIGSPKKEHPPEIQEILDKPEEERTKDEQRTLSKYMKGEKKGIVKKITGGIGSGIKKLAGTDRPMGIVDQDTMEVGEWLSNKIGGFLDKVAPNRKKQIVESEAYKTISESKAAEKVKAGANKAANFTGDLLLGKQETNESGEMVRNGGVLHAVAKPLTGLGNAAISAKIAASNKLASTKTLERRTEELLKDYGPDKTFDESNTDALQMQLISSEINAAMSNGDYSNIDDQTISKAITKIQDKDIQRQLKQSVIPLLKRNGKVVEGTKEESKGKGVFSKVATLVKGGIRMILAPIVGYIKLVIGSVFMIIKKGVGLIINFAKKHIKHGLISMKAGAKSLGQGVARMFKPMTALAKKAVDITFTVANKINSIVKKVTPYLKAFGKKLLGIGKVIAKPFVATAKFVGNSFKHVFGEVFLGKKYDKDGNEQKPEGESDEKKKGGLIGKAKEKLSGLGDKLAKTSFGQGFMKATKERKEAQAKAKLKEEAAPIKEGIETSEVGKDLQDALEAEDGKKGFFKKLITLVQGIFDKTPDPNDPTSEEGNGESGGGAGTSGGETTDTGGTVGSTENGETSGGEETPKPTPTPDTGGGDAGGAEGGGKKGIFSKIGGAIKGGASDILGGIGEALGGLTGMMGGLLEIVLSIVMSLEGFKALTTLVMEILKSSLEPLNEAFQAITKALKPILKQLGGIIKQLAEFIVVIVDAVVDVIKPIISDVVQPVLEVVAPLLQSIIGCLTPLLKIVGILLKVIMAPLMGLFKFVLLPILKIIGDAVQIIMGVLQIGFGLIMICLGGIIGAIGKVISCIPGAGGKGKDLAKSGGDMLDQGKDFVAQGLKSVAQGIVNIVLDYASLYTLGASDALLGRGEEEDKKETKKIEAPENSSAVQNTYANGDVNNYYGSSDIYNTYGGEYQRGMGGYLNMDQRGCGPIALADMYNRNQSGRVSARSLAGSMFNDGTYDPRKGTSVGGYIDSARSLGMNLTPGKVTQQSLKSASPTNPITVVGSGSDYGTRNGNNHFMNVIGTDRHGGAYVSNPLTGRIDRRPASTVAGSAVLGLYGSGDAAADGYTFPDAIKDAFKKLKDEAAKILGLFSMEKSEEEETEELINAEQKKAAAEQAKKELGEDYAQYEEKAKAVALEDFKKKYPQKDGESDEDYQAAFDKWWEGDADQAKYLAEAGVLDSALEAAKKKNSTVWDEMNNSTNKFVEDMQVSLESIKNANNTGHDGSGSNGKGNINDLYEAAAQVWEGATKKFGHKYSYDDYGPITTRSGITIPELHPDCSGMLSATMNYMGYTFGTTMNGSKNRWTTHDIYQRDGNDFVFKDGEVSPDWEIIPYSDEELREGDIVVTPSHTGLYIRGDQPNAYGYDAGDSNTDGMRIKILGEGAAKAYLDGDTNWKDQLQWTMGPGYKGEGGIPSRILRYVKSAPGQGYIELSGMLGDQSAWSGYSGRAGVPTFINAGKAAGMSGAEIATLMSTGIWEDGGEKIFGLKSLNDTTYDYNGQAAKGIMNWVDQDVNYGNTVTDQLKWIHNTYFDAGSDDYRAFTRDNGFLSQDTQAFKTATGRSGFTLNIGDRYGPHTDQDLVEGSAWFFMDALVPEKIHTAEGMAQNVGTAADAYNWMIDNGYIDISEDNPSNVSNLDVIGGSVNSAGDARMLSNLEQIGTRSGKNTGVVFTNDGDGLWLQTKPQYGSSGIIIIPDGTQLNLETSGSKEWFKTSWAGNDGYVCANYIKLDNNDITNAYKTQSYDYNELSTNKNTYNKLLDYANASTGGNEQTKETKQTKQTPSPDAPSWYNFSSWFSENSREKRNDFYKTAAENHKKAMEKKTKNGGVAFGKDKLSIDAYVNKYGTAQVSRGASKKYAGDEQYYQYQYANAKDKTKNASLVDYTTFPVYTQLQELGKIYGAGDVDSMLAEDTFWNNYLGWNNKYNSNVSIPMSDGSDTAYSSDTYYDPETGTTVVNNYAVTRAEDKATDARLKAVLANTYNVRSETMEALLNAILEELKKRRDPRGGGNNTNGSTKLFDERIPSQVTRLSVG